MQESWGEIASVLDTDFGCAAQCSALQRCLVELHAVFLVFLTLTLLLQARTALCHH